MPVTLTRLEAAAFVDLAGLTRVAGADIHPGGGQLKHYWTKDPEGLAKWASRPHGRWTALYHHLLKHMNGNAALAKATASEWFHEVFGYWPGHQKGDNPTGPRLASP